MSEFFYHQIPQIIKNKIQILPQTYGNRFNPDNSKVLKLSSDKYVLAFMLQYDTMLYFIVWDNISKLCSDNVKDQSKQTTIKVNKNKFLEFIFVGCDQENLFIGNENDFTTMLLNTNTFACTEHQCDFALGKVDAFYKQKYFCLDVPTEDFATEKRIYEWKYLTNITSLTPFVKKINNDHKYFALTCGIEPVVLCIDAKYDTIMMTENLIPIDSFNVLEFFEYKCEKLECCEYHFNQSSNEKLLTVNVNDNCMILYENHDPDKDDKYNGSEKIYCYDFENDLHLSFPNRILNYYCTNAIPVRNNDDSIFLKFSCYYLRFEWDNVLHASKPNNNKFDSDTNHQASLMSSDTTEQLNCLACN